jgi:phenylacetate-coenzyme A ligase PaaK-like adenylate-forming protein
MSDRPDAILYNDRRSSQLSGVVFRQSGAFRPTMQKTDASQTTIDPALQEDLDCLRNLLLPATVLRAWEGSRFYRELYDGADVDPRSILRVQDLRQLPIVKKTDIRAAGRDARCFPEKTRVSHVQHTSGTTGKPFFFYRAADEARFIREFFSDLARDSAQHIEKLPLTLVLSGMDWHGTPTQIPGNSFPIHCSLLSESYFEIAVDLLRKEFDIPGVTGRVQTISASNELLTFTSWCLERGIRCREEFAVRAIQMTGFYVTQRWRKLLSETWGAVIFDRYTMAEHFGGATRSSAEDGFRFDPNIAYELVEFSGRKPAGEGPGMMLLTSLHPFVQLQPLIRYWTGDIFRPHPPSKDGAPAFEFLGRESHALFHPDDPTQLLLSGVDAVEALDDYPEVSRTSNFQEHPNAKRHNADGYPVFGGSYERVNGRLVFRLRVEVTMSPYAFPLRTRAVEESMRAQVLGRSALLAEMVESGDAEFILEHVPAGQLEVAFGALSERLEGPPRAWNRA